MKRVILPLALAIFVYVPALLAQTGAHTPAANSAERKAVLDALRAGGSEKTVYQVHFIRIHDGWAWVDATPLDAQTKKPTAEGGPNLVHLEDGKWKVMDLSRVPEDPNNPLGAEDASPAFVKNVRKTFKGCPADIFPKPSR